MPVYRMQCSFAADSALPRDRFVLTPHFSSVNPFPDMQSLVDDLADALAGFDQQGASGREVNVRAYDAQSEPPNRPLAEATRAQGVAPASRTMREIALCLSFYSQFNEPRRRGRLYLPLFWIAGGSTVGPRPSADHISRAALLPAILQNLGGTDVDWCVFSRRDNQARAVTHWWIDDEFDVQRRRGLRPTGRTTGTTSEGGGVIPTP